MLRIVTLPFDEEMEEFEQGKLQKILGNVQIVKYKAELMKINEKIYWTAFVEYEKNEMNNVKFEKNSKNKYEKNNSFEKERETKNKNENYEENFNEYEKELYKILKEWRLGEAQILGFPPYIVASNKLLAQLVINKPKNMAELALVKGMGERKIRDYGEEILLILENFYDAKG